MRSTHLLRAAIAVAALALWASGQDIKVSAREAEATYREAVVTIRLVVSMSMMGDETEEKLEVVGTMIEPSGLTVVSAGSIIARPRHVSTARVRALQRPVMSEARVGVQTGLT